MVAGRPGGGETPRLLDGLRALVVEAGPSVQRLAHDQTEGIVAIMKSAAPPASWTDEDKATAILAVVAELVDRLNNPRWKAAAQAAFRLPPERFEGSAFDSLMARWRDLARQEGETLGGSIEEVAERYRGYWRTSAAPHLAQALESRLHDLNSSDGWQRYRSDEPYSPPLALPISFERTEVLYQFDGTRGIQSTSQRWLVAHGAVDHYEAVGWYYSEPDAPVDIVPVANCTLDGLLVPLPQGGRAGTLRFSHELQDGERYYFSYTVRFNSQKECRPTILYEVRGLRMDVLMVRAQFDPNAIPVRCWHFDIGAQSEGYHMPPDGAPEFLKVQPNGYVAHEFRSCKRGRKYGLRWIWPDAATPPLKTVRGGPVGEG